MSKIDNLGPISDLGRRYKDNSLVAKYLIISQFKVQTLFAEFVLRVTLFACLACVIKNDNSNARRVQSNAK